MADNISFISTKSGQHSKQKRLRAHVDYDEMTVIYGRISLAVPIGFKACLENVTREVLREQPKDIPAFLACYFNQLNENQKKGISANNLVTERIVEVKAFEEQGVQKEEEKVETQEAGNLTDDCQVSNVQSQTEMPAPVPVAADDNQLSFEQQQEIEHEGDENQQNQENEDEQQIGEVTEEVKAVCLEDILKQEEYKQNENAMSLEEQEKIDHQEETTAAAEEEENSEPSAENEAEQNEPPKPVCLEQLLKEKEQSQIIEENPNPKKIESAPSTNQPPKTDSNENQAKATQSEPAVLNNSASEVPSHISLDALPDNIKLVEAIVKTSVTELAEEENADKEDEVQEQEEQEQEEQKQEEVQEQEEQEQEEPVENTTEQKIDPAQEEAVDDKNGDIEA